VAKISVQTAGGGMVFIPLGLPVAIGIVVAYFQANGYRLAAELLSFAVSKKNTNTVYHPQYGYRAFLFCTMI